MREIMIGPCCVAPDDNSWDNVKPAVEGVLAEVRESFPGTTLTVHDDGECGAYVILEEIDLGAVYPPPFTGAGPGFSNSSPG